MKAKKTNFCRLGRYPPQESLHIVTNTQLKYPPLKIPLILKSV